MNLRFMIGLCVITMGALNLTSCQPRTPKVVWAEAPLQAVVMSSDATVKPSFPPSSRQGRVFSSRDLNTLPTNFSIRDR